MKRWVARIALATAVVFLALGVGAATCLFSQEIPSPAAHHHTGGPAHSPLCAWACQANQSVDQVPIPVATASLLLLSVIVPDSISRPPFSPQYQAQSRAPPRS